jgi:hypothetical protein
MSYGRLSLDRGCAKTFCVQLRDIETSAGDVGRKTRAKGREDAGKRKQSVERCRNKVERFEAGNCTLSLSLVLPPRSLDRVSNRTHHPGSVMLKCRSKAGKRSRQNKASRRRKERKSRENPATVGGREEKEEGECGRAVEGGFF